jgi:hypothetical protein
MLQPASTSLTLDHFTNRFDRFIYSQALVELIEEDDLARRATFPEKAEIREIACHLAARVFQMSIEEGIRVSQGRNDLG